MRVALDTQRIFEGPAAERTHLLELLPELLKAAQPDDQLVLFYAASVEPPDSLAWLRRYPGFAAAPAPLSGGLDHLWRRLRFPPVESVRRGSDGLDVCHSLVPPAMPARAARRVLTLQGAEARPGTPAARATLRRSIQAAGVVIVPAERTRALLARSGMGIDDARVVVVPPGVNDRYRELPKAAVVQALCDRYPLLQEPYLLDPGAAVESDATLSFLLEVYARARASDATVPPLIVLAGAGEGRDLTEQIAAHDLGRQILVLAGLEPEALPALYRGAEMVLDPSWRFGFGQALLEAAACGVPAIADPRCAALETIAAGALAPEPDAGAWARAIVELHRDAGRRRELGDAARGAAAARTWSRAAALHWEIYGH